MTTGSRRLLAVVLGAGITGAALGAWFTGSRAATAQNALHKALYASVMAARDLDVECARSADCDPRRVKTEKARLATVVDSARSTADKALALSRLSTGGAVIVGAACSLLLCWLVWTSRQSTLEPQPASAMEKALRERLEQLYDERQRARENARFASYGEIAAGLSHGLKTPLASVRAIAQLVQAKLEPDHVAQDHLDDILDQVDELVDQINRFLETMGSGEPARTRVTAKELIAPLELRYAAGAPERQIGFTSSIDDDVPDMMADSELVEMALRNLVDNALFFARGGTEVTVAVSRCPPPDAVGLDRRPPPESLQDLEWIELAVIDTGRGIPRDIAEGKEGESSRPGGSGLGVAIARRIAARHGGTLIIDAVPDEGTCARFILPPAIDQPGAGA